MQKSLCKFFFCMFPSKEFCDLNSVALDLKEQLFCYCYFFLVVHRNKSKEMDMRYIARH